MLEEEGGGKRRKDEGAQVLTVLPTWDEKDQKSGWMLNSTVRDVMEMALWGFSDGSSLKLREPFKGIGAPFITQ